MKEISIKNIESIKIGQVENQEAATGCTVFLSENGMRAGTENVAGIVTSRLFEWMFRPLWTD